MRTSFIGLMIALLGAGVIGCASKRTLYFGTQTNLGVDVSGTTQVPDKVSLAYARHEAAIVPRGKDGKDYSVVGRFDADVKFLGPVKLYQLFATGNAARAAANAGEETTVDTTPPAVGSELLVFGTQSLVGFNLSAGGPQLAPQFVLGYKRSEATAIPLREGDAEARSTYGELSLNSTATDREVFSLNGGKVLSPGTGVAGLRIVQVFATGEAAKGLAGGNLKSKIQAASGSGGVAMVDTEVSAAKQPFASAYNHAKTVKDTAALDAFDRAAKAADFSNARSFFISNDVTATQVGVFERHVRAEPAAQPYLPRSS